MTPQEARTFLESSRGHPHEAAFTLALLCGLRVSELLGLSWDCVELDGPAPSIKVRQGLKFVPADASIAPEKRAAGQKGILILSDVKTAKSRRSVHLPGLAASALAEHRKAQLIKRVAAGDWPAKPLGADLVFRADNGQPIDPSNFRKALSKVTSAAGLGHWHPHELRHSAASILLDQGVPLKTISETLGHSSITITADIYSHLLEAARAEPARAMDRAFGGSR
jgi:integrase